MRMMNKMFFKWGIDLFDSRLKKYGGFNHFLAGKIFRWKLCYLTIYLKWAWDWEWEHRQEECYYDGYHNHISLGFVLISYGT